MPIVAFGAPVIVVPPPTGGGTTTLPAGSSSGILSVSLSSARGDITLTHDGPYSFLRGATGFGLPPMQLTVDDLPDEGGLLRSERRATRPLFLPVFIEAALPAEVRALEQRLFRLLAAPVTVTVAQPDGSSRHIRARYAGGMEGAMDETWGSSWRTYGASLLCLDPCWYGAPISEEFGVSSTKAFLSTSTNFFPVQLAAPKVLGDTTVDNAGDVDSWPIWSVHGPGTSFTATNTATGESFTVAHTLAEGESFVVDTRPLAKTVTGEDGANLFGALGSFPALWSLAPGLNDVHLTLLGATSASTVSVSYEPRYLSA